MLERELPQKEKPPSALDAQPDGIRSDC